jgi:5-(carboxyamino)imidazole ribonucleotide synthase
MMLQASRRLKSQSLVRVLARAPSDPAAQEALGLRGAGEEYEIHLGEISDSQVLSKFLSGLDVVTFESELVDITLLETAKASFPNLKFVPELSVMRLLSEKLEQKKLLARLGISATPFEEAPLKEAELPQWIEGLQKRWGAFVLKWSKFGYDGRGVVLAAASSEGAKLALSSAVEALKRGTRVYAEPQVRFVRELALISVRSTQGEFRSYPLVVSQQKGGACHWVTGPAVSLGVSPEFEKRAQDYAVKLSESLGLCGTFAIEMFETAVGDLWVNEIAPRVHNSGHFSQDASNHDQFEMHLRTVIGTVMGTVMGTVSGAVSGDAVEEKLPHITSTASFAMLNLLSPKGIQGHIEGLGKIIPEPEMGSVLHWYGKDDLFPGRKLGHVNSATGNLEELQAYETKWIDYLKGLQS